MLLLRARLPAWPFDLSGLLQGLLSLFLDRVPLLASLLHKLRQGILSVSVDRIDEGLEVVLTLEGSMGCCVGGFTR